MTRTQLIRLIHVARRESGIDDDTYREKLRTLTGHTSCKALDQRQLEDVYQAFKDNGFKRTFKRSKTPGKPRTSEHQRTAIISKIRAVWAEMHRHGFIQCGSAAALDQYVKRMTATANDGEGVARIDWLTGDLAGRVVESLKKWHAREMRKKLESVGIQPHPSLRGYAALAETYNRVSGGKNDVL
ncbi:regulatory protein GemA [Salmonella enterica]|nr:regulatory protein GemA [Salmonella enterica]